MEIIIGCVIFVVGYWVGMVSGYSTGSRSKPPKSVVNIEYDSIDGVDYFYEMETDKFLIQDKDHKAGLGRAVMSLNLAVGTRIVITKVTEPKPVLQNEPV